MPPLLEQLPSFSAPLLYMTFYHANSLIRVPPGCKASSPSGNGYDIYDLYDLGEFDQKGGKETKWGTKEELLELVKKATDSGVGIYWDAGKACTFSKCIITNRTL